MREGEALSRSRAVTAMMDISDGLASEVNHIAEESGVGALVPLGRHLHVVGEVVSCEEGVRLVSASGESRVLARAGSDHFAAGAL